MDKPDDIVGHKTFHDGDGYRHEPLTRVEADQILAAVDAARERRAATFPTPEACARGLWDAWYRLKELGWKEARYAPPDGREKQTVSIGSSGIHSARCMARTDREGENWWWADEAGDTWPHSPTLYLPDEQETTEYNARMEKARALFAARHE